MRKIGVLSLLGLAISACLPTAEAGYKVTANTVPGGLDGVRVVAIAPGVCPADFDCAWLEDRLVQELVRWSRFQGLGATSVRQAMLELGVDSITDESRKTIAEKLDIDAFLVPVIAHSGKESTGASAYWAGGVLWASESSVAKGNVELLMVRASDGKIVMKGAGFGQSEWRTGKGVVLKSCREILERGFGPADR